MTDRHFSPNNRSRIDQSGYLPWQNMSGEEVPAFAVIQLKTNFDGTSKATKPDEFSGLFYTSGPVPVPATKFGESLLWHKPQRVLIDGEVTVGDEVGPVENQWYMSDEGSGFRVLRQPTGGVGIVERVGGGGTRIRDGIVVASHGCGYYTIELGYYDGNAIGSGSADASGGECDPCASLITSGADATATVVSYPGSQIAGSGTTVEAYDPASIVIPLVVGTDCVVCLIPGGPTGSGSGSTGAGSGSGAEPTVWRVIQGCQEHVVKYEEEGDCCGPGGTWVTLRRRPTILIGHTCPWQEVDSCPSGSGS